MADEILSVKLRELDDKITTLHRNIQLGESGIPRHIKAGLAPLRAEITETELLLQKKLECSKSSAVAPLSAAYREIEAVIQRTRDKQALLFSAEEKILVAEYALDFALQAADRALLSALEAISAETVQRETGV